MKTLSATVTIGGLAKAANVGVETIRYYQRRGLLRKPDKPYNGVRRYESKDMKRLTFIRTAQSLGFSLDEVADLLRLDDDAQCEQASALAEGKLEAVRTKIGRLQSIERVLREMVHDCHVNEREQQCPLILSLYEGLEEG